jgi:integrase
MQRLAAAPPSKTDRRRSLELEVALMLAEGTGRRLGSIGALRWDHIDFARRTMR